MEIYRTLPRAVGTKVRNWGRIIDSIGEKIQGRFAQATVEQVPRCRRLIPFAGFHPVASSAKFIAPNASVIGQVELKDGCTVWYGAIIRADSGAITIGANSHILERAVIKSSLCSSNAVVIGENVYIESGAIVEPCVIEDDAFISSNSILLEGCHIGRGAVVGPKMIVGSGQVLEGGMFHTMESSVPLSSEQKAAYRARVSNLKNVAEEHESVNTYPIERLVEETFVTAYFEEQVGENGRFAIVPDYVVNSPTVTKNKNYVSSANV